MKNLDLQNKFRRLPYMVVDLAISEGWTRELAYFLKITSLYGNGVIYDYSSRSLAQKLGVSKSAVHTNVSFLLSIGLLTLNNGTLKGVSLKGLRSWCANYSSKSVGKGLVTVKVHNTIKHTEWNLFARVPLNGINRQKYNSIKRAEVNAIRAKVERGSYISSSEYKRLKKYDYNTFGTKQTENASKSFTTRLFFMSDNYFVERTGKSVGTVRSMIKFWVSEGLISSTFHKGGCLDTHVSPRSFEAIKVERSSEFSNTYLYRGRIMAYNKRSMEYGANTRVYKEQFSN